MSPRWTSIQVTFEKRPCILKTILQKKFSRVNFPSVQKPEKNEPEVKPYVVT